MGVVISKGHIPSSNGVAGVPTITLAAVSAVED
jgi:hypothetical protein